MKKEIKNLSGDKLDYVVEGKIDAGETVVFAHGFGVCKNETAGLFVDLSKALQDKFRVVRFDFSGVGDSEGSLQDMSYKKMAGDLEAVFSHVREEFGGEISILAHSMGCFVTSLLLPDNIRKTIFSGIPNGNMEFITNRMQERITSKGGSVDENGISVYPRTSGEIHKFGPEFWLWMRKFEPIKKITEFSKKTELEIIHPAQDDIVGSEFMEDYKTIPGAKYLEIDGDHSYTKPEDRKGIMEEVERFFGD